MVHACVSNVWCRCGELIWEKDKAGALPLLAAAKAGHKSKHLCMLLSIHVFRNSVVYTYIHVHASILYICLLSLTSGAVERLLFHMLKDDALKKSPSVELEIKHSSLTAITNGYHTYFEVRGNLCIHKPYNIVCIYI